MSQLKGTYKEIIQITWPLLLGNASHTLIALTDSMFMSRVNTAALASVGYISLFYMFLVVLGYSYTKSVQIQVAKRMGEKDEDSICYIVDSAMIIMLVSASVFFVLLFFYPAYFLRFFTNSNAILESGKLFLTYRVPGIFFNFFGCVLIAYYTGIGKTRIPGISMFTMLISNVLLNYLFVFGHWGFPSMGIAGSGLASTLAEVISVLVLLSGFMFSTSMKKHKILSFKAFSYTEVKALNSLGLPIVGQAVIGFISWIYFFSCIEKKMGIESLAISNLLRPVYQLFSVPSWSLANSVNTFVSNLRGQRKIDEIMKVVRKLLWLSLVISIVSICVLLPFPKFWIENISGSSQYVDASIGSIWMICIAMFVFSISIILFNVIVSIGSSRISLFIEILSIALYLIYTYFIFYYSSPTLTFAWSTEILYWFLIGLFSILYLRYSNWKQII